MVRHNNMLHNVHLKFDWADKVKTWFNQPGRKHRRRVLRQKKAKLQAPNPTHKLRPIVRGQTNKYNTKIKLGRGFTVKELKEAGIRGLSYARSLGIAIDLRRKDTSKETLDLNAGRIKEYLSRMILYPRKENKPEKKFEDKSKDTPPEKKSPGRGALLEFEGRAQNICAWAKELGISANTLYGRIYKMNWSIEKAFTTPTRKR